MQSNEQTKTLVIEAMHREALKPVADLAIVRHSITKVLERARHNSRWKQHVIALQHQVNNLLAELGRDAQFPAPTIIDVEALRTE